MGSMKGGKEDEKSMAPMFPRLHVNDADKGGPRAPPRNKMSLYEQLSIPSQKFNSATLPPHKPGSAVPSASSLQEHNHERIAYSSLYLRHSSVTPSAERPCSQSSDGKSMNRVMEFNRATDRVDCTSRAVMSDAGGSTFNVHDASGKNSLKAKHEDDDDDFRVPILVHAEPVSHSMDASFVEVRRPASSGAGIVQKSATLESSFHVLDSSKKPIHDTNVSGILSKHEILHSEQKSREALSSKEHEDDCPDLPVGEILADPSKNSVVPSDLAAEDKIKFFDKTGYQCAMMSKESAHNGSIVVVKSSNDSKFHENINTFNMISESSSAASSGYSQGSYDDKAIGSGELKDTEKTCEVSEVSMIDSISEMEFSPDDVVGVIGPKQFWKARREIVNQQRVFAVQVFELHRLIKVQKLFAASPQLLLDDSRFITTQSKVSMKSLPIVSSLNYHSPHKPNPLLEKLAVPTQTQEKTPSVDLDHLPKSIPHSINPLPIPLPLDNRTKPWYIHQPQNQWLIPVMSPSEGLIYKPYAGSCLPTNSGFMAPFYGSCGLSSMPSVSGNFMNTSCGIPLSHQQQILSSSLALDPNYFGIPSMSPVVPASGVEHVSPLTSTPPNTHTMQLSQSSCNMSIAKSIPLSGHLPKNNAFKDSEVHASTASSPCDKAPGEGRDMLPLFPTTRATERSCQPSQSCGKEHQSHVIKVVPHNARSATESAARIFRSIQEERQQPYL